MAYNIELAERIQEQLQDVGGIVEKKMFGGVGFLLNGNMVCGVHGEDMIVRVGEAFDELLSHPHTRPFDMTGRPMKGWLIVERAGLENDSDIKDWVQKGLSFASTLPPK